jgi:ubiquinone/menaquinone biosynthesis C-methylase UbiE
MVDYAPQVTHAHYGAKYRGLERWLSYYHQLALVESLKPASVLEIGPGEGIVTATLRHDGIAVTTCDIAEDLRPDVVGSVTKLPLEDKSFDLALASEVLEHIEWHDVEVALKELARVSKKNVVVSLPHPGQVFISGTFRALGRWIPVRLQVPFFWKTHRFNGEHYWELGKKGYAAGKFVRAAKGAGLTLKKTVKYADDPVHRLFIFEV